MNALLLMAALAAGQNGMNPKPPPRTGGSPADSHPRAETRKEARDQVLRAVGPEALAFTKHFSDLGIYALSKCEPATGKRLVELFHSGELLRLSDPRLALEAVRQHGEVVAAWLVMHHARLSDPDALACFAEDPLEFVYDLKEVGSAAEARRASRKIGGLPWNRDGKPDWSADWRSPALIAGGLVVAWLVWKRVGNRAASA